ncbi:beta-lactamase-like protein [Camillea tinctor]|nr:beta-lactamase-like protein [Camillea tinctor]
MEITEQKKHKVGYRQINKTLNICAFEDYLEAQLFHLPEIADVEQITPRVLQILGQNAGKFTLQGTNTYIVGTGSHRLIIDTAQGIPEWADILHSTLADIDVTLSHVLITHWHGDHASGIPDLIRMYPELSDTIYKHTPSRTQKAILDGQIFSVEGATIRATHAPGHAHDHMCFILEEERYVYGRQRTGTWKSGCRAAEHLDELLAADGVARVCDLALARMKRSVGGRGNGGSVTVGELVIAMHGGDLDDQVRQMAIEPFTEEVLRKLAEDGKVALEIRRGTKNLEICSLPEVELW